MNNELMENFVEKLRLIRSELIVNLNNDYKRMLAEHSRDGMLGSGATIKKTMNFIVLGNASLYSQVIEYLKKLNVNYTNSLESDVQALTKSAQEQFKIEALTVFQKSTEIARSPNLYGRMLPELESEMASNLAVFQNSLNAAILELKIKSSISPLSKSLWFLEAVLLLSSMFIAGMWYKDPNGNYEPILLGLGLVIPLVGVIIKLSSKKAA